MPKVLAKSWEKVEGRNQYDRLMIHGDDSLCLLIQICCFCDATVEKVE